jgi:hypothetical protein
MYPNLGLLFLLFYCLFMLVFSFYSPFFIFVVFQYFIAFSSHFLFGLLPQKKVLFHARFRVSKREAGHSRVNQRSRHGRLSRGQRREVPRQGRRRAGDISFSRAWAEAGAGFWRNGAL